MYNLYTNSIISLRSRASLSFSFNDHQSYSCNGRYPSSSSCCCCCCCSCNCCSSVPVSAFTSCRVVPISPSPLYGFRQSTLIQLPPSRRRYGYGALIQDLGRTRISHGGSCCVRERIGDEGRKSKGKGIESWGYSRIRVLEERFVFGGVGAACEDAEAMMSLLTEEVGEECFDVKERRRARVRTSSSDKGKVRERSKIKKESGNELENVEVQHRKEGYRMRNEREDLVKGEDSRLRKGGSSSSYHSCSDMGDYESVSEFIVDKHEEYAEEGLMVGEKASRKRVGGIRISEQLEEESERRVNEKDIYLDSGRRDDSEMVSSSQWDLRKKSEETASRKDLILNQSRLSETDISSTQKATLRRGGESTSDVISSEALRSGYRQAENQVSEISNSSYRYGHLVGSSEIGNERTISSLSNANGREANVVSASEFCRTCGRVTSDSQKESNLDEQTKISKIQDTNTRFISKVDTLAESRLRRQEESSSLLKKSTNEVNQQHLNSRRSHNYTERADAAQSSEENTNIFRRRAKHSEIQNTDRWLTSTARQQPETRIKRQEETSTLLQTSSNELNERSHREHLLAASQTDLIRKSTKHGKTAVVGDSYVQGTSRTQHQQEDRMKGSEDISVSILSQHAKGEQYQTGVQVTSQRESRKASEDVSGSSQVRFDETGTASSQGASEQRLLYEQSYLKERLKSVEQRIESREQVNERVKQTEQRYEVQRPLREAGFHEKETSRHPYRTSTSQIRIEEIGGEEDERNLLSGPSTRLPPPPQSFERHPMNVEPVSRFTRQDSHRSSEGDAGIYIYPEDTATSPHELASGTYEESSHVISDVDLLGSAERMDSSSLQVVGDFIERATHEASTSEIQMGKTLSERQLLHEGTAYAHEESTQSDPENSNLRKLYSRRSSGSGTTKGPTDEMWTLQEPPEREASESAPTSGNVTVRRNGRTLWNVLSDIVRFRWVSRAESHRSTVKSGAQSSSGDSVSSEAWFSGHDPDEAQAGNAKRGASSTPQEPSSTDQPLLARTPTQSPRGDLRVLNTGDNAGLAGDAGENTGLAVDSAPLPSSGGISGETNLESNVDERSLQATTSVDWAQPAAIQFRRSHRRSDPIYEVQEGDKKATGSGTVDQIKDNVNPSLTTVLGSEENAAELKRRKLLRNKQVMKERFDEWEEAYRLESEQRKIDEIFMREALEEAKKAGDMWEVPVGAVLVRDGKIIARGYNLVEDLRDSTAHAEMICIREASSVLRTWRLSETTLYVTLEPCAMCAGAILQARIGTLVYGAPNKLLGADGSWIRLFPSSVDREGGSESTAKPEGPVHPFHPKMTIRRGILEAECAVVMQQFFKLRRKKDKKTEQPDEQHSTRKLLHPSKLLHKMHHIFHFLFCL